MKGTELAGQVALVTGASRGIGLAIASELADAGARIAVIDLCQEEAANAAAGLPGSGHRGYVCDVTDGEAVDSVVAAVESDMGAIEVLVNNAGITQDNLLLRLKEEQWDKVLDINLKGGFLAARAAAKYMVRRRSGRIINIASVVGIMGNRGQANYAASKAGLIGLTKSLARELASRGITCNAVAPGYIETGMTEVLGDSAREALANQIALGRLGKPEDVAMVVRFLAGPGAGYITGQVIVVDGGMVI